MKVDNISLAKRLLSFVDKNLPPQNYSVDKAEDYEVVHFVLNKASDYDIDVYLYGDDHNGFIECGIHAVRRDRKSAFFWHIPFESPDYESPIALAEKAEEALAILLTKPSRVVQRKRFLFWDFLCEYQEAGNWKRVYGMGYLRLNPQYRIPKIEGKEKFYHGFPWTPSNND